MNTEEEIANLRKRNSDLHRRCQQAESAVAKFVKQWDAHGGPKGGSFGRALLAAERARLRDIIQEVTGIEAEVCADIASRQAKGIAKYGVTVADNPLSLREWLQHAYEETLDQAIYLKRAITEINHRDSLFRSGKLGEWEEDIALRKQDPHPRCHCHACNPNAWWMVVCAKCGNKRCPHATHHDHKCTGSNAPGQPGSLFQ